MRFAFWAFVLFIAVLGLPGCAAGSRASAVPDHLALSWTKDPATTMTMTWRTDTSVKSGTVQYEQGSGLTAKKQSAKAAASDFSTDQGTIRVHTATLTGLSEKTQYAYRVGDGAHWSGTHTFTTADPKTTAVKFLVFGDSQSIATGKAPYKEWRTTVQNAFTANPDAQFMVNVGDLVDTGQSGAHWDAWFSAAEGVIDTIPEMPVVGNHELYGSPKSSKPNYWLAQFTLPQNGPKGLKEQAYSFNYGPVHCVVLDSQQGEEKAAGDIFTPQKTWLEKDLAAANATWNLAFFHKSPYELKPKQANPAVKAAFCPTMEKHHVDLVFNGHDHGIARTYPIKNGAYKKQPSQGTIYYMTGRSGIKTYDDLEKRPWDTFFYDPQDQPNYLVVEVQDQTLTVTAVQQDGAVINTFVIDKQADSCGEVKAKAAAATR